MLFKKYNIVIFKDKESGVRSLRLSGWFGFLLIVVIIALTVINLYLWRFYTQSTLLERDLEESSRVIQEQTSQLLGLSVKLNELSTNLNRVQKFDERLRVLMNIDTAPSGGNDNVSDVEDAGGSFGGVGQPQVLMQYRDLLPRRVFNLVDDLNGQVVLEEVAQQHLLIFMQENRGVIQATPSIWPTKGRVTSGFGYRRSPFRRAVTKMHKGLDVANKIGTPIMATAGGTVTFAGSDASYGNSIRIDHGNNIVTQYAHMQKLNVKAEQLVQRGEVIGTMGNTGRSTGPHLHYEVRVSGVPVNPLRYILN